jgi:pyruvate dehydrogenase (quinone)
MSKNVSDQLVETLVDAGIQKIYAVTGDSLNHVNAAVHRNGKIKWIHFAMKKLLLMQPELRHS